MSDFRFRAVDPTGTIVRGSISARSEVDLESRLRARHLELLAVASPGRFAGWMPGPRRVALQDLVQFCIHMAQLEAAGVPILDALADIRDATASGRLRSVLDGVRDDVHDGSLLSEALARHPSVFDAAFVGVVGAGEQTGDLGTSFLRLERHLKWRREVEWAVRKAVRYPLVLLVAFSAVALVMMGYLVPRLVDFLLMQQVTLPWPTRALVATSDFIADWGFLAPVAAVLAVAAFRTAESVSEPVAITLDRWRLRAPLVGPVRRKIALARFTHFFAMMFASGVGVLQCLRTAEGVVANRAIAAALAAARERVEAGQPLSAALAETGMFPGLVLRMVRVGEDTGRFEEALDNVGWFYDREVRESVDRMVGAIEPALIAVVGAMLLWIVLAVFGPLYDSLSGLG